MKESFYYLFLCVAQKIKRKGQFATYLGTQFCHYLQPPKPTKKAESPPVPRTCNRKIPELWPGNKLHRSNGNINKSSIVEKKIQTILCKTATVGKIIISPPHRKCRVRIWNSAKKVTAGFDRSVDRLSKRKLQATVDMLNHIHT